MQSLVNQFNIFILFFYWGIKVCVPSQYIFPKLGNDELEFGYSELGPIKNPSSERVERVTRIALSELAWNSE